MVSIIILSYNSTRVIEICLNTLTITEGDYEVIVVDNGSTPDVVAALQEFKAQGLIDKLILEPVNHMFSEGNNIGVRNSSPEAEYVLLLNSDVAFLRPDWMQKQIAWMEGTATYEPTVWNFYPTQPSSGPRDIVSIGWSHDGAVEPSHARPEGWCCMFRKSVWQDLSPDFPWHYGFEEMIAKVVRGGARIGLLFNYAKYLVHAEGGSGKGHGVDIVNRRTPDIPGWFAGLNIETLDFTLGENEHQSYLQW